MKLDTYDKSYKWQPDASEWGKLVTSPKVVSKLHARTSKQCHMDDAILGIGKVSEWMVEGLHDLHIKLTQVGRYTLSVVFCQRSLA